MYLVWLAGAAVLVVGVWWRRRVGRSRLRQQRLRYVQAYAFQPRYHDALRVAYPKLDAEGYKHAEHALRQFFIMHLLAPGERLLMPSNLADALWHTFILDTRRYQQFCHSAFGDMFHHLPAQTASEAGSQSQAARMQPSWNAAMHTRRYMVGALLGGIPLLFALDAAAAIDDGWLYPPELLGQWAAAFALSTAAVGNSADSGSSSTSGSDNSSQRDDSGSHGHSSEAESASSSADSDGGSSSCSGSSCGGGSSD